MTAEPPFYATTETHDDHALRVLQEQYREFFENPREYEGKVFAALEPQEPPPCTCEGCPYERTCAFSWDVFNTNGDCVLDK